MNVHSVGIALPNCVGDFVALGGNTVSLVWKIASFHERKSHKELLSTMMMPPLARYIVCPSSILKTGFHNLQANQRDFNKMSQPSMHPAV